MMNTMRKHRRPAIVTAAFALAAATAASASAVTSAHTNTDTGSSSVATAPAYPTFVHLPADQAAHAGTQQEWWYVIGHLTARGHRFGYEVQIVDSATPQTFVAITDQTTGAYYTQSQTLTPDQVAFSTTALDLHSPAATLSGPMNAMHLHATLPVGDIDLTLDARGPVLYNNGTGLMPFLGGSSYYYSLPSVASQGTITENHRTYQVTGESWVDRQWGTWDWGTAQKWTWMAIQLANGDRINLWDLFDQGGESHYATVLHPDGTEQIVAVDPLADGTSDFWTSPTSGKRYGTRWKVTIPALGADLTVVTRPQGQEIQSDGGIFEGASSVSGRYRGRPAAGEAYVEQLGDWH